MDDGATAASSPSTIGRRNAINGERKFTGMLRDLTKRVVATEPSVCRQRLRWQAARFSSQTRWEMGNPQ
jgi:hypothetical protein